MKRLIGEVRQRWHPNIEEEYEPRGEGYTDEGHFNCCVYKLAFTYREPDREGHDLCEAELLDQVLLLPNTTDLADRIPQPLAEPAPQKKIDENLAALRAQLQEQFNKFAPLNAAAIQSPNYFVELLAITDGINGAGVPSETAHTSLIYPFDQRCVVADSLKRLSSHMEIHDHAPLNG